MKTVLMLIAATLLIAAAEFPPAASLPVRSGLSDPFLRAILSIQSGDHINTWKSMSIYR